MKKLNEDFKSGKFEQVYLLYGEEGYLKKQYKKRFIKAMIPEGDTMNYAHYEGKNIPVKEVIDLAETMPFFAEKRLIVFENTGFFKTAAGAELADYIKEMPETTYFIFVEEEVDKRNKLYKAVNTKGYAAALTMQDEEVLKRWIGQILRREGKEMSGATISYFLGKVGTDMENIQRELEKVICYGIDKATLTREEIDAVCVTQLSNHIFDMVDAVAAGNQRKALDLYYDLLALKEAPMRILFLLSSQFQRLMIVKSMTNQGFGNKEIALKAGCPEWAVRKYQSQSRAFSMDQLKQAIWNYMNTTYNIQMEMNAHHERNPLPDDSERKS